MNHDEIDNIVRQELTNWQPIESFWAADIAMRTRQHGKRVFDSLQRLACDGDVVRLTDGRNTLWKTTVANSRKFDATNCVLSRSR